MTISEYAKIKNISYKAAQAQLFRNGERISCGEYKPCLNCADKVQIRKEKAKQMKEQGYPIWAIAEKLGICRKTIYNYLKG